MKFLGIVVDEQLSFKHHIENVTRKLAVGIAFLHRGRATKIAEVVIQCNSLATPDIL